MFKLLAYFKFLLKSTNQHGVHSPFVYDLVTKCFYGKPAENEIDLSIIDPLSKKKRYFLKKIIHYFSKEKSNYKLGNIDSIHDEYYDLIFINHPRLLDIKKLLTNIHNDSIIVIDNIHISRENENLWNSLVKSSLIKVSIDTFKFGLLFIRKEQVKQHFIIRA